MPSFVGLGMVTPRWDPRSSGLAAHTGSAFSAVSVLFTPRALGYLVGSFGWPAL